MLVAKVGREVNRFYRYGQYVVTMSRSGKVFVGQNVSAATCDDWLDMGSDPEEIWINVHLVKGELVFLCKGIPAQVDSFAHDFIYSFFVGEEI